jgi:UDP-N-acetylglucosamine--N-acetylmuramyl-(pentapeptide) pyrophosphoryl-undecaprenol N-acetylglucosamine transferase
MEKRILLVGGGSGGHAYPLLAVAKELQKEAQQKNISLRMLLMGEAGFLERAAKEAGLIHKPILAGKLRRYFSPLILLDLIKLPIGILQSLWHVFWFMPDAVFSKGGYDSIGPVLAARLYFIPVYLHESDTIPGLANRIVGGLARNVFVGFAAAEKYFPGKAIHSGNPVRSELLTGDRIVALRSFQFSEDTKTVLIFGGSQGAKQINDIITTSLAELVHEFQIIHQSGESQYDIVRSTVDVLLKEGKDTYGSLIQERYRLYAFLSPQEMANAYAAADIIISRAGAGSLFEIASLGKPAIIIPLPGSANNHQLANAIEFSKAGVPVVEGGNMTTHILTSQLHALLEPAKHAQVSQSLKALATPDAAAKIAQALLS